MGWAAGSLLAAAEIAFWLPGLLLWLAGCALAGATESASTAAGNRASNPNAHSLIANIIITPIPSPGQPWCEAQVGVDGEPCFSYDCRSNEVKAFCVLGMKVEAPLREEMRDILKDLTPEFRGKLLDVKPKDSPSGEPLSLQATMVIQEEAGVVIRGSWHFVINGGISLFLNLVNRTWTVNHPEDTGMLEKWGDDRDMNDLLWRMSHGDCRRWLQRVAVHWEMLGTTAPLGTSSTNTSIPTTIAHEPWFIPVIIISLILFVIFMGCVWKRCLRRS